MLKNNTKKLSLHAETLATLTSHELDGARGGTGFLGPIIQASVRFCVQASVPVAGALEKVAGWVKDHQRAVPSREISRVGTTAFRR